MSDDQKQADQAALLANARHELRTPLNAIIGYSEILIDDAEDLDAEDLVPDLRRIREAGAQILGIVNDVLSANRLAAGGVGLDDLHANLRLELRTPLSAVVGYSEMLLESATDSGRDEVVPDLGRIHTAAHRLLALVDDVVAFAEHGADDRQLDVLSSTGITLEIASAVRSLTLDAPRSGRSLRGRVLVVDDNEVNRSVLSRRLEHEGCTVAAAENGRAALEMLAAGGFDLVLLDIIMPELNGVEVLERMKADEALREIPVVMISALDELGNVVRCLEIGAEDYLPKPFNAVLLRARIGACLEKKRLRDMEVEYLRSVTRVTDAAAALEAGTFDDASLQTVALRDDALGGLARVFARMAREVHAREQRLKQQVEELRVEIDRSKMARQVAEITDTDYFRQLKERASEFKRRPKSRGE